MHWSENWNSDEHENAIVGDHLKNHKEPIHNISLTQYEVDWTNLHAVTAVRNQGRCNIEWAAASASVLESYVKITTGTLHVFSMKYLAKCLPQSVGNQLENKWNRPTVENDVLSWMGPGEAEKILNLQTGKKATVAERKIDCGRANVYVKYVLQFVKEHGIPTAEDYNKHLNDYPNDPCSKTKLKHILHHPKFDIVELKGELETAVAVHYGVVLVVHHTSEYYNLLRKGLFRQEGNDNCGKPYHASTLVGTGKELINKKEVPFWKFKNSWGEGFAEGGYYNMLRGQNVCAVENLAYALRPEGSTLPWGTVIHPVIPKKR